MGKRHPSPALNIFMNGYLVGQLQNPPGGTIALRYNRDWQSNPGGRPISLSLPIHQQLHTGKSVYNFFDNLLPDNPDIRLRIQRRFGCETAHPFDLLCAIGHDCVGALQLTESSMAPENVKDVHARPISRREIAHLLRNYQDAPLGMSEKNDDFRISIAGAQEKTALLRYGDSWHIPLKTTPASHIFKLPIGVIPSQHIDLSESCENEWLCLQILDAFGIPAARANIETFEDIKVLVVERFDRQWSHDNTWLMRLPQEDVCQALGYSPGLKYESDGGPGIVKIMELLMRSTRPEHDRSVFMKTQIVFWLLAAIDGHAKNFSIFLKPESRFSLTPLYDIMTAYPLFAKKHVSFKKAKMAMRAWGEKKSYYRHSQIRRRHWLSTATKVKYPPALVSEYCDEIFDTVENVIRTVSDRIPAGFPGIIAETTFRGIKELRDRFS